MRWRIRLAAALAVAAAWPVGAQLIGQGGLPGPVGRGVGGVGGIGEPLGGTIGSAAERVGDIVEPIEEALGEPIDEALDAQIDSIDRSIEAAVDEIERVAAAATEVLFRDEDPAGQAIERDIWVVLVPEEFRELIPGWGFEIRQRQDLEGLDLVLLRIAAPEDRTMTETEQELTRDAPGTVVDFNHFYGPGQAEVAAPVAGRAPSGPAPATTAIPPNALALGLIDSAIAADHPAFNGVTVVQQDFAPFKGERPRAHGTAVASIAFEALKAASAPGPLAVLSASVFSADDAGELVATTGSLVAALEWLGSEGIEVINMSLAGPPNRVLEAALAAIARRGTVVVAAVGNDGPAGEPRYPAAYESVLGVTAVDDRRRVYRHANRGSQVAFSAPGVRVRAASSGGDFRRESGTSMAAPVAAALIASALAATEDSADSVLRRFEREAIDLGEPGFDDVYGHGLIAPPQ